MTTIADKIADWAAREIQGATVMTKNTEAYSHMQEAIQRLKAEPWATLVLGPDMVVGDPSPVGDVVDGGTPLNT